MPHQCTACGRGFADGSRQMLSGCPDCGGSTFQFLPDGGSVVAPADGDGPAVGDAPGSREAVVVDAAGTEDDAQAAARGSLPGADRLLGPPGDEGPGPADAARPGDGRADRPAADGDAGALADDAPGRDAPGSPRDAGAGNGRAGAGATPPSAPGTPDVEVDAETVAEELDSQFESIRILEPGQYVINLMELYERDEHVIAVRENGRYVIDVAESRLEGE